MNIKKQDLIKVYNFLNGASLVGAVSRARTKLNQSILAAFQEFATDERDLIEDNGGTIDDKGHFDFGEGNEASAEKFYQEKSELYAEAVIFEEATQDQFNRLKTALESYDKELSNQDAEAYDILLSALEEEK